MKTALAVIFSLLTITANAQTYLLPNATLPLTGNEFVPIDQAHGNVYNTVKVPVTDILSGAVTSVTFTGDGVVLSSTPSTAVTTTGTLLATLKTQLANKVLAGPTSGGVSTPAFRSLVIADLPVIACSNLSNSGAGCTAEVMTSTVGGLVPTPPNDATQVLLGDGTFGTAPGLSGITALTGDITATGPGSVAATLPNIVSASTNLKITYNAKGQVTAGTTAACADLSDDGVGCRAGTASISTAGIAKLHNTPTAVGWPAALDPNNVILANINQASTISAIVGAVETPVGATATLTVSKAPSGTACSAGTVLHSGIFNANGTASTNQPLTVTTSTLAAGDRICLQTTNSSNWTSGVGIGTITVFLSPS